MQNTSPGKILVYTNSAVQYVPDVHILERAVWRFFEESPRVKSRRGACSAH